MVVKVKEKKHARARARANPHLPSVSATIVVTMVKRRPAAVIHSGIP